MQSDDNPADSQDAGHQRIHWGRISLLIIGALLAGLATTIIWLLNDTDRMKTLAERAVTSLTGRALSIRGAFDFELGSEISISAEQLTWANAAWSNGPAMLSIGSAVLTIDTRSILQPPLLIT